MHEWAKEEEERRRNAPDPNCPPGMKVMDDQERIKTLNALREDILFRQLNCESVP